ncbi:hypothetical protein GCM10010995_12690 [Cysteiniphilum litorale]|uniref:Uncharacterized protein n=2 Tax=Fastidiosibacteraceae TaxID=2056687 RepID=A0A8J3E8X6_9GAMM|nr:hypothetical protein GCM10010995_12690 [Cysteiniphilum litorale]
MRVMYVDAIINSQQKYMGIDYTRVLTSVQKDYCVRAFGYDKGHHNKIGTCLNNYLYNDPEFIRNCQSNIKNEALGSS